MVPGYHQKHQKYRHTEFLAGGMKGGQQRPKSKENTCVHDSSQRTKQDN